MTRLLQKIEQALGDSCKKDIAIVNAFYDQDRPIEGFLTGVASLPFSTVHGLVQRLNSKGRTGRPTSPEYPKP